MAASATPVLITPVGVILALACKVMLFPTRSSNVDLNFLGMGRDRRPTVFLNNCHLISSASAGQSSETAHMNLLYAIAP